MTPKSQTRQALELAITRIRRGVPKIVPIGQTLSIAAVAKEAGVSNATIHNRYPEIADAIRKLVGDSRATQLEVMRDKLNNCQASLVELRKQCAQLKIDLQNSQSINFRLLKENELLRTNLTIEENVIAIRR